MNGLGKHLAIGSILFVTMAGCGGAGGGGSVSEQPKMSPEEVQKEIQKLSPPATKGKSR